jgi:hypothetical protein
MAFRVTVEGEGDLVSEGWVKQFLGDWLDSVVQPQEVPLYLQFRKAQATSGLQEDDPHRWVMDSNLWSDREDEVLILKDDDGEYDITIWPDLEPMLEFWSSAPNAHEFDLDEIRGIADDIKCWGFCEAHKKIHLWVSPEADLGHIAFLIGHEYGHTLRPFKRDHEQEEGKCDLYGDAASLAQRVIEHLQRRIKNE